MEQPYTVDPVDQRQNTGPQMRRVYLGEEHDLFRQPSSLDMKYPFPQAHLFPPSSSVRGGPIKNQGTPQPELHTNQEVMADPRFGSQEFLPRDSDDKRFKGAYSYPAQTPGVGLMNVGSAPAPGMGMYNPSGAGATLNGIYLPPAAAQPRPPNKDAPGLLPSIPPLHVQHVFNDLDANGEDVVSTKCSRCKKDFSQKLVQSESSGKGKSSEPKLYKLCLHCRDLQRQRSRRWQKKTKDKKGACRRCGGDIPEDEQRFVLCPQCRQSLRIRKANRAAQGRCVHCSGPITSSIAKGEDSVEGESSEEVDSRRSSVQGHGSFKVCKRCRENDKIRRTNLERMGNCNRCAQTLPPEDHGKHKVCFNCRQKKKKQGLLVSSDGTADSLPAAGTQMHTPPVPLALQGPQQFQGPHTLQSVPGYNGSMGMQAGHQSQGPQQHQGPHGSQGPPLPDMQQNVVVPAMNYVSMDQNSMLGNHGMNSYGAGMGMSMAPQEMPVGYGQPGQPMMQGPGEMYKPPMAHLPQLQPQMDQSYQQQYLGYQPGNRSGAPYSGNRM